MKISKFIISAVLNTDKVLLYHTLNTALVALPKKQHDQVFAGCDFSDNKVIEQLCQMGFLLEDHYNEDLILDEIRKAELDSRHQTVNIFSTNKCNAKCYYCFEEGIKQVDMTRETASQTVSFIEKFYPDKKLQIMWFGGEPLLNFEVIKQITQGLKKRGYELTTHVTTNGSLVNQEIVDFFKEHYAKVSFQITIDEINEKYYEIKCYEGLTHENAFATVINNSKRLMDNNIFTSIRINFLEDKIDNAINVYLHIKDIFAKYQPSIMRVYLTPLTLSEGCDLCAGLKESRNVFQNAPEDKGCEYPLLKLVKFQHEQGVINIRAKDITQKLLASFLLLPKGTPCAASGMKHVVIDACGNLYKCHRFANHYEYVIGNVHDGVDRKNVHYNSFIDSIMEDDCKACNILPICQGGCKALKLLHGYNLECKIKQIQSDLVRLYYNELLKLQT